MTSEPTTKRKTIKQVDAEQNADEQRIAALEAKVKQLEDMVVFLNENPTWRATDYLAGASR